jgi:hypothetical protein
MGLRQARTPDIALIAAARADASRLRDVLEKTP